MGKKRNRLQRKLVRQEAKQELLKKLRSQENKFEILKNKIKQNVIGRKVCKSEIGKPYQSRHKAIDKRKKTLLNEFLNQNKSGKGSVNMKNSGSAIKKSKIYDDIKIGETADLTHKGEALNSINIERTYISDEEDDESDLLKRGDYIETAHFGGGAYGLPKDSKEFLDEVIQDKRKRQIEREENIQLTKKLDEEWMTVRNLVRHKGNKSYSKGENDDYDVLVKQLMYGETESRGPSSDYRECKEQEQIRYDVTEKLQELMKAKDLDLTIDNANSLLSIKMNKLSNNVANQVINQIKRIKPECLNINTFCFLVFSLCVPKLHQLVILKFIETLENLKYDDFGDLFKRILICKTLHRMFPDTLFPEIIVSLQNFLVLFSKKSEHLKFFLPSFKLPRLKNPSVLAITPGFEKGLPSFSIKFAFEPPTLWTEQLKVILLKECLNLLDTLVKSYMKLEASQIMFNPILKTLRSLISPDAPFTDQINKIILELEAPKVLHYLSQPIKRPMMLTMIEPRIETIRKSKDVKKLSKAVKREYKGAKRELKKDSAFLKNVILKQTLKNDTIRKEKVKKLLSEIAVERSIFKKKK